MKIFKTVLGVVIASALVVGCQNKEKVEKTEAAKEEQAGQPVAEQKEAGAPVAAAVSAGKVTVADIFAKKVELNGKSVTVSGKVVKINMGIMGKNWIHLQDGTGSEGTNDVTITTDGEAKVNDKVSITGTVVTDKDFGSGYKYAVMVENATVKAE